MIAAGELDWRVSGVIVELQAYLPGAPAAATRARFLEREKTAGKSVEQSVSFAGGRLAKCQQKISAFR